MATGAMTRSGFLRALEEILEVPARTPRDEDSRETISNWTLIGVLCCRPAYSGTWEIDTWLMSCRTLGRLMGKFMFDRLVEAASREGVRRIAGVYRPAAENALV
jgi:hypothetical protein